MNAVLIPSFDAPEGIARFDIFMRRADRLVARISPSHTVILCALLYEGLGSYEELSDFLQALQSPLTAGDEIHVHWTNDQGRLCGRALDHRTRIAVSRSVADSFPQQDLNTFRQVLLDNYPTPQTLMSKDLWDLIFHDALAWLDQHLPKFCFGIVIGSIPITAVPPDVLARLSRNRRDALWEAQDATDDDALSPAHDGALEMLLEVNVPVNRRARCLKEIQGLFALRNQATDIRLSDPHWRKSLYGRLAITSDLIARQGTEGDALILLWVHHLLSVGSVRLTNPSVATISRYVSAAAGLISENYARCTCSAVHMDDEQWIEFFDALKQAVTSDPQRPALASFHQFCIQVFGAPPMAQVIFLVEGSTTRVHANTVWAHEIHEALKLAATVSSDPRICASVQALLALAAVCPLRIGEAQALRLEDFVSVEKESFELRYHPRRGQHQGKSHSAKRLMRSFGDPPWVEIIISWVERRRAEEVGRHGMSALLFGDPHRRDRTYLFATCSRLANRLLKQVCGDSTTSFHTLRHAWVNRAIVHHVSHPTSQPSPTSWLQGIAVQVGHAQVATTLEHYFHLPELALRCTLNNHWRTDHLSTAGTAFWTGRSPAALRKSKQRRASKSEFLWSCIAEVSSSSSALHAAPSPSLVELTPLPATSVDPMQVRKILADLQASIPAEATAFRCSVPPATVSAVIHHSAMVLNQLLVLDGEREHVISDKATQARKLQWLRQKLEKLEFGLGIVDEPSWKTLVQRSSSPTTLAQRNAVQSWMHCRQGRGIALRPDGSADAFLRWLSDGAVNGNCVVLKIPMKHAGDPYCQAKVMSSDAVMSARDQLGLHLGTSFTTETVNLRKQNQAPYVLLARTPIVKISEACPPARLRMAHFHGFLFSLAVWLGMNEKAAHA